MSRPWTKMGRLLCIMAWVNVAFMVPYTLSAIATGTFDSLFLARFTVAWWSLIWLIWGRTDA